MGYRAFWWLLGAACCLLLSGCYYFRLAPSPLQPSRFAVDRPAAAVFAALGPLLERDGYRVERAEEQDLAVLTEFRNFSTRVGGVSQPEGGRLYYHRLKVTIMDLGEGCEVTVASTDLEIRSSYVYSEGGKVTAFKKRYPYDHYPGMFDLSSVDVELARMKRYLQSSLLREGVNGQ